MKAKQVILLILRLLIGLFFITTAVLKLFSLDEFEVYIYSFNIFGFVFSTVVARLVIMAELLLGICLMSKMLYKYAWWLTQLMLLGFTFLLIYIAIFRNDTNCHCLGDFVELNPVASIIKNLVTMALLFLVKNEEDYQFKGKKWALTAAFVVAFAVPFCVFPMDVVYNKFVSPIDQINKEAFANIQVDSTMTNFDISKGNYVVAVYASGCKYCKMSAKKINQMLETNRVEADKFQILIWGDTAHIQQFREETKCERYPWHVIHPYVAIDMVYGQFPTFILTHDGEIVKAFDYRGMDEKELSEYLK